MVHVPVADILPNFLGQAVDDGRLKFIEPLGSGAYGMVYKALDTTSPAHSPVYYAVKCLKKYPVGTREAVFQARELKLHQMVSSHPNIISVHRHFSDGKHIFVVLDLCTGGDLFVAITENHRYHRNTVLVQQAFVQLLDAVQYCHKNNVFHRDLKPENILCDSEGANIRLADFGLSTQSGLCSDFGLGSPYYMSPEAINQEYTNGSYSTRHCDIWALGVILTNMICGRNPWKTAETEDECFVAFLADSDFLLKVLPISRGANSILKRCFKMHPLARPSISQIREEVLKIDTFFITDKELAEASSAQRAMAQYYATPVPDDELSSDSETEGTICDNPNASGSGSSIDSEEVYLFSTPQFDSPWLVAPPVEVDFSCPSDSSSEGNSDSSTSGAESSGPITPATHPVDPTIDVVDVPDLPEDQNIDESAAFPSLNPAKPTHISVADSSASAKPTLPSRSLLKRAMKRIKAIGN
ncbi:kinase-like domain-containing protein [Mycena sp. CBHHK59/15]|nr:kinase-like domain-containing protein [Mycena sp. CBHHK59/15]